MAKTSIVCEGRTSNEAIEKGLKQLHCTIKDVDVKILENEDKKIFFSILDPRVVKVELTLKDDRADREYENNKVIEKEEIVVSKDEIDKCKNNIDVFLKDFCEKFGELTYEIMDDEKDVVYVNINGKNSYKLIGYRGDVLNAFQTILNSIGNRDIKDRVRVFLNVNEYKEKREQSLKELAHRLEKSVYKSKKKAVLEPMNSYDRKIIHTELQNSKFVKTYSVEEEPHRHIVVDLK